MRASIGLANRGVRQRLRGDDREFLAQIARHLFDGSGRLRLLIQGYQAADFLTKYPGRFLSMHLQDWSPEEKKEVAVGKGAVDWKKTFEAAKKGGG